MRADRWEYGSWFPLLPLPTTTPGRSARERRDEPAPPWNQARLYGSGRHALRALLTFGRQQYGWQRLHVPAYFCPDVVDALTDLLPVQRYDAGPFGPSGQPDAGPADVVLTPSYFGDPPQLPATAGMLITDVTHDPSDPWSGTAPVDRSPVGGGPQPATVRADYAVASLRKTLPVPDGGALWAADGRPLPPAAPQTAEHLATAGRMLTAMCLKAAYLAGAPVAKQDYLALGAAAEAAFRSTTISGISDYTRAALAILPAGRLRRRRIEHATMLAADLTGLDRIRVHHRPFGVLLEFDSHRRRDTVRNILARQNVYTAVLWTLRPPDVPPHQLDLSQRLLHLHTDARWSAADLHRVACLVREACAACPSARTPDADGPQPGPYVPPTAADPVRRSDVATGRVK